MTDFCVNCGNKNLDLICTECNEKTIKIYEDKGRKRIIDDFLKSIQKWLDDDIPKYAYLDDEIEYWIHESEKWEKMK